MQKTTVESVGVGVIGAGTMGQLHAKIYKNMPGVNLVGVEDNDKEKADSVAAEFRCRAFYSYGDLLQTPGIDAVSVATPDHLHYEIVMACLDSGKHVLVEKPLTTNLQEAQQIVKKAEERGLQVMVNYNNRWGIPYQKAKEAILAGVIGTPLVGYARKINNIKVPTEMLRWASATSCVHFLATHDIDMILWYFDYPKPIEVYAAGCANVLCAMGIPTFDVVQAIVRFAGGKQGCFECGWIYPRTYPTLTESYLHVIGEKGVIHIDRREENIVICSTDAFTFPRTCLGGEVEGRYEGALKLALEHFIASIRHGTEPEPNAKHALRAVEIAVAIHLSLQEMRTVKLPL
ncbi:MAG: Gfo/Idh/MocA family oxidoreductase [Candidatus Methanomethyliaceae archaeon]